MYYILFIYFLNHTSVKCWLVTEGKSQSSQVSFICRAQNHTFTSGDCPVCTGVTNNNINNDKVIFKCPSEPGQWANRHNVGQDPETKWNYTLVNCIISPCEMSKCILWHKLYFHAVSAPQIRQDIVLQFHFSNHYVTQPQGDIFLYRQYLMTNYSLSKSINSEHKVCVQSYAQIYRVWSTLSLKKHCNKKLSVTKLWVAKDK